MPGCPQRRGGARGKGSAWRAVVVVAHRMVVGGPAMGRGWGASCELGMLAMARPAWWSSEHVT